VAGCGGQSQGSPAASGGTSATSPSGTSAPSVDTGSGSPAPASRAPAATAAPTAALVEGFHYSDILKVQVDRLAARIAPNRTAALVHAYDISGPAPIDGGLVRLNKGDFVSVQLGPLRIDDTVWYLVWPAPGAKLHPGGLQWYTGLPPDSSPVPAWVAGSVGADVYLSLQRRPDTAEIEAYMPIGLNTAGSGNYESAPLPRHDLFLIDWAAAAPKQGTSCSFSLSLAPADEDVAPEVVIKTSTTSVKVSELNGFGANVPWLPIPAGAWDTFTIRVTSTCTWALRFVRLDHD
jgi:hypothetical protein